jgi:outer membrane lipoprotein-sorting protein
MNVSFLKRSRAGYGPQRGSTITRVCTLVFGMLIVGCAAGYNYTDISVVTPKLIFNNIESQSSMIKYFSSSGYGNFETPEGDYSARFDISIRRPSTVYVRIYGPFGMKLAQVKFTSDTLIVYNSFRNELYVGKPTEENLSRFLMIAPEGSSITNLLLGLLAPPVSDSNSYVLSKTDGRKINFTYDRGDTVQLYGIDGKYLRISKYEESIDGETILRIQYSDFTSVGNVYFPKSVLFEDLRRNVSARLFYQDIELTENDGLEFTVPSDAKKFFLN